MTRRQIDDDVKSGDLVEDEHGNRFVVIKREGTASGSEAERKVQLQTMRRLLGVFRLFTILAMLGLLLKILSTPLRQDTTGVPDTVSLIFYAVVSYAISVILGFLINLAGWMERVNKRMAKQANRAVVNELLGD